MTWTNTPEQQALVDRIYIAEINGERVPVKPVSDEERARVVAELQANPYQRPTSKCEHAARLAHDMPMSIRRAALQWGVSPGSVANTYQKLFGKRRSSTCP